MKGFIAASALAVAMAGPAAAQVVGTYAGTTADGNGVSFVVSVDGNGALAVTGNSVGFTAACKGGGTLYSGWGWGSDDVISNRKVSGSLEFAYATILWNLTFAANGASATGFVSTVAPTLAPVGPKPTKAQVCTSRRQAMSLTLLAGAVRAAPRAGAVVALDRQGRGAAVSGR